RYGAGTGVREKYGSLGTNNFPREMPKTAPPRHLSLIPAQSGTGEPEAGKRLSDAVFCDSATPGERVHLTVPWVQIPPSPPSNDGGFEYPGLPFLLPQTVPGTGEVRESAESTVLVRV